MASRSLGTLTLDLIARIGGFESGMDRAARTADRKGREISASARKRAKETEEAWSKVGNAIGAVFASIAVGAFFQKFARETMNAEKEQAQLAAVLRSTGNAAGYSKDRLNEMAGVMESSLGIAAGEVNKAQTVLLAFTNIVGDQLPKALQAAADHAARTGSTISASAEIMGRALDVPSVGMASLQKQGFKFSESQIELARELERTGKVAQAQQMVLDSLNESYGGAAAAARDTFGGALGALQNTINSLLTGDSGSMAKMKEAVEGLNTQLSSAETRAAFQTIMGLMADMASAAINAATHFVNFGKFVGETLAQFVHGSADPIDRLSDSLDGLRKEAAALEKEISRPKQWVGVGSNDGTEQLRARLEGVQKTIASTIKLRDDFVRSANNAAPIVGTPNKPDKPVRAVGAVNNKDGAKKPAKAGKTEAEKEAEAAEKFLKSLREQAFKIQEKTAYEKLFFDLQEKGLSLSDKQMDQAIGLVTAIDMAKESERTKAAEIERQNALYEVQGALLSKQQQYDLELATAGMGGKAAAEMRERISLLQEYQQKLAQMRQDQAMAIAGAGSDSEVERINAQFQVRIELTKKALDTELEMFDAHSKRKQMIEFDWSMGASAALNNYLEEASNVYAQTESAMTTAFKGMEDALVSFATTGKLDFKSLANSIIADLIRIQIRASMMKMFAGMFGGSGSALASSGVTVGGVDGMNGYAEGGYTGAGGKYQPAGIVHAGEYVINAESTKKLGLPYLEKLNGYASGGLVGAPPIVARGGSGATASGAVKVEIINNGAPATATATREQQPDGSSLIRVVLRAVADDMSSGGVTARATAGRFGLATQ